MNQNPNKGPINNPYTLANTVIDNRLNADDTAGATGDRMVDQCLRQSRSRIRGNGSRELSPSPERPVPLLWEYSSESESDDDDAMEIDTKSFSSAPNVNTTSGNA